MNSLILSEIYPFSFHNYCFKPLSQSRRDLFSGRSEGCFSGLLLRYQVRDPNCHRYFLSALGTSALLVQSARRAFPEKRFQSWLTAPDGVGNNNSLLWVRNRNTNWQCSCLPDDSDSPWSVPPIPGRRCCSAIIVIFELIDLPPYIGIKSWDLAFNTHDRNIIYYHMLCLCSRGTLYLTVLSKLSWF